jgi:ribonucleoside-diphosphate reductase alpha chain
MKREHEILSQITVWAKYAKYRPELNRRETWEELVERNKQMHLNKFPELAETIELAYKLVLEKKILPSMRSLQFGGLPIEVNNSRLFNCFGEETKFITDKGVFSFSDFKHGDSVKVMTHKGRWMDAVVKSYGKQKLSKLKFKKGRSEKIVRATDNHTWILKNGTRTQSISVGDGLAQVQWFNDFDYWKSTPEERVMWAYGYVFGDGTLVSDENGNKKHSMVRLCDHDTKYEERFLELGFKSSKPKSIGADVMVYTGKYLKEKPSLEETSPEHLRAFIRGYLDADGAKNHSQTQSSIFKSIQSSRSEDFEWMKSALEISGFFITGIDDYTGQETNFGIRPETLRFRGYTGIGESPNSYWYLQSIEEDVEETVWCLEVEEDNSFVLSGGLLTGNCSYLSTDDYRAFNETIFLLLSGVGVGYSVQRRHIENLPSIKKAEKTRRYLIDDSIQGWSDSVKVLIKSYLGLSSWKPSFDYRAIRAKGERLITSGGVAPGPEPLKICLTHIEAILERKKDGEKLTSLDCHDIMCHIADAVLSGGIRRSAMIALFDHDDEDMLTCKFGNWWETNPQRGRANNSAVILRNGPVTKEMFLDLWKKVELSNSGEPGFYFSNDENMGTNPCCEIALQPFQFCNLVEVNASDIQDQQDLNNRVHWASVIGTLQASYTDFHYLRGIWKKTTEKEALLGIGMTGIASGAIDKLNLEEAAQYAVATNIIMAKRIGINPAARVTCVKPSGTSSLVLGTSSGVHAWHDKYYIRRMRVGKNEAIYTYLSIYHPELIEDDVMKPQSQAVVSIPVAAPEGAITRSDETAIEFLERVKKLHNKWIKPGHVYGNNTHNVSATVTIKQDEWAEVGEWLWENQDHYNGLSFLPEDLGSYQQTPFETITKEEYVKLVENLQGLDVTKIVEVSDNTNLSDQAACAGGIGCEVI